MLIWAGLSAWFGYRQVPAARSSASSSSGRCSRSPARSSARSSPAGQGRRSARLAARQRQAAPRRHRGAGVRLPVRAGRRADRAPAQPRVRGARRAAGGRARGRAISRGSSPNRSCKLLQLQIEPHFLFNTLGSAQQLAERGAPDAARLIADLIRFLRAATPAMRDEATTLAPGGDAGRAYLSIMRTRLGRAAATSRSTIPPALRRRAAAAGHADHARRERDQARHRAWRRRRPHRRHARRATATACAVDRRRTGAGLDGGAAPGQGIGLANIRERLALLYGDARVARARRERAARIHRADRVAARGAAVERAVVPVMATP